MGDVIAAYEAEHYPIAQAPAHEVLRLLMQEHDLRHSDLPEVGSQGVVSEILSGKRTLNTRQIRELAQRFGVDMRVFLE
jgi:HTH-type transcriptional regulator/antitoxin HigA